MIDPLFARFIRSLIAVAAVLTASLAFGADAAPSPEVLVEIADVGKSKELASLLTSKGFKTTIPAKSLRVTDLQTNSAVWIGKNVPLEALKVVLPEAMKSNQYITFFHVVGDRGEIPPEKVNNTIHIGGSIEGAVIWKLNPIDQKEMLDALAKAKTLQELHAFLHEKNIAKEDKDAKPEAKAEAKAEAAK